MAWEKRSKRRYYYEAKWENGRVVKRYLGHGIQAQKAALKADSTRNGKRRAREVVRRIVEELDPVTLLMKQLESSVRELTQIELLSHGYHQHRGNWRKRRVNKEAKTPPASPAEPQSDRMTVGELINLAKAGRTEILPTLRAFLDDHPEVWQQYGNLGLQAQEEWLNLIAGENLYLKENLRRNAEDLRKRLAGEHSTPLEELQAERIVALNLQVAYYEVLIARYELSSGRERILEYLHKQCATADFRLERAMTNLARVRKLLPRTLNVNVFVSGEVQTTVQGSGREGGSEEKQPKGKPLSVPENRIKDLLAAASN